MCIPLGYCSSPEDDHNDVTTTFKCTDDVLNGCKSNPCDVPLKCGSYHRRNPDGKDSEGTVIMTACVQKAFCG